MNKHHRIKSTSACFREKYGFTLVEIVVTISIIAIMSAIAMFVFVAVQRQSRDAQRSADITDIKAALGKYHDQNGEYPAVCSADNSGCSISLLATPLAPFLKTVPNDPLSPIQNYSYVRGAVTTDSYGLYLLNESKAPCKDGMNINTAWWGSGVPIC